MKTNYFFKTSLTILLLYVINSCKETKPEVDFSCQQNSVTFQGSVIARKLKPNSTYVLTINGKVGSDGNEQLLKFGNYGGEGYLDFEEVTADGQGNFNKEFSKVLPVGKYNVTFLIKDKADNFKSVYDKNLIIFSVIEASFVQINGTIRNYAEYGSSSIDFPNVMNFNKGTILKINVGGTANKILVRLLEQNQSPDQAVGIIGQYIIPENRIVEITLDKAFQNIAQISIHGNPNPFGIDLGKNNGSAQIISIESKTNN